MSNLWDSKFSLVGRQLNLWRFGVCLLPTSESSLASHTVNTQTPHSIVLWAHRMEANMGHIRSIYFQRSRLCRFQEAEGWWKGKRGDAFVWVRLDENVYVLQPTLVGWGWKPWTCPNLDLSIWRSSIFEAIVTPVGMDWHHYQQTASRKPQIRRHPRLGRTSMNVPVKNCSIPTYCHFRAAPKSSTSDEQQLLACLRVNDNPTLPRWMTEVDSRFAMTFDVSEQVNVLLSPKIEKAWLKKGRSAILISCRVLFESVEAGHAPTLFASQGRRDFWLWNGTCMW